jgi:carboxyl-terminal processing protease
MIATTLSAALPFLLDAAVKGTILLALAFLAYLLVLRPRRASAAVRHLLWTSTLVVLLAAPILTCFLTAWRMPLDLPGLGSTPLAGQANVERENGLWVVEEPAKSAPAPAAAGPGQANPGPALVASRIPSPPNTVPPDEPPAKVPPAPAAAPAGAWIVSAWLIGALLSVVWLLGGWLSLVRLGRCCEQVRDGTLHQALSDAARKLGIRRPIRLLLSSHRAIPMTWGLFRPVVLLPQEGQTWSAQRLDMVLVHELGHVQRWDCLVQLLGHVVRGLYWFHPLAWLAVRQLRIEQEHACDDLVLEGGAPATDYAEHLLAVTTGMRADFWTAPVALGMGRSYKLRRRLVRLLDAGCNHRPARRRAALLATVAAIALAMGLGAIGFSQTPAAAAGDELKDQVQPPPKEKDKVLLKKLEEVQQKLAKYYVHPVDEKTLADHALRGLLQGLKDPYTDYVSPEDLKRFDSQLKGNISGIGAHLQMVDQRLTVATPLEDSPALKSGLRPGDLIDAIDGKSTRGFTIKDAIDRILGPAGSVVKLKVVHPEGVVAEIPVTRAEIRLRSVNGFRRGADGQWQFLLDAEQKIGYLQVQQFSGRTASEVREAITAMQKDGLKGLILDLRFCPGGFLEQAIDVCKMFLAKGVLLTTRGPAMAEKSWKADGKNTLGDFPLLILINDNTASAAEIVAGALRDHERAVLLGSRTYGKGSVQSVMKLEEGGALKVTTAYHYLPNGRNIQKRPGEKTWGVDPSDGFYFPLSAAQTEALRKDAQKRALLGLKEDEQPKVPARLTPKVIEEQHADPQLAAALRSMVARITGGEFLKVGKENAALADQAHRLEEMRQRRDQLLQSVKQLDREIAEMQKGAGK